ncbi:MULTISPECIES: hypothetical protein [Brasilonema]|nr:MULTISPECIES: hypothetical protein [Brasilonema]
MSQRGRYMPTEEDAVVSNASTYGGKPSVGIGSLWRCATPYGYQIHVAC